jgi:hypothetical protein
MTEIKAKFLKNHKSIGEINEFIKSVMKRKGITQEEMLIEEVMTPRFTHNASSLSPRKNLNPSF